MICTHVATAREKGSLGNFVVDPWTWCQWFFGGHYHQHSINRMTLQATATMISTATEWKVMAFLDSAKVFADSCQDRLYLLTVAAPGAFHTQAKL